MRFLARRGKPWGAYTVQLAGIERDLCSPAFRYHTFMVTPGLAEVEKLEVLPGQRMEGMDDAKSRRDVLMCCI